LGKLEEALASYNQAIVSKPEYAEAYYYRGMALQELRRSEEAVASYNQAIAINPHYAEAYRDCGIVLRYLNRLEEALACYSKAISISPDYADAYYNRGNLFLDIKRTEDAIDDFNKAISIKADYADAFFNRGHVLQNLNRLVEALADYDCAIGIRPDYAEAHSNRGNALLGLNRLDDALASYDQALAIKPDFLHALLNKALYLLLIGDFEEGWNFYESRCKTTQLSSPKRSFPQPMWLGEQSLDGKTILLHAEQGFGDSIQFCRYVELVSELGATVLFEVPKPLFALFKGLKGVSHLIEAGSELPAFDYHCPLLSLPLALKTTLDSIPNRTPYLKSDPVLIAYWKERLGMKTKLRVGLVWSGNPAHKNDRNRSLTLAEFIAYLPAYHEYVSLQRDIRDTDVDTLQASNIHNYGNELVDYAQTAALCDLMDLVISVDTSVAHLSGALGKPTWILLPYVPDWRWLLDREDNPWYGTVKLFRQSSDRLWGSVLTKVQHAINESRLVL
jgi:Tfp pilus assembly protein PilF